MMRIEKPIFIIGAGRSGSTIFHNIFSRHPDVSWLSALCDRFPDKLAIHRFLMQSTNIPVVGKILRKKIYPGEAYHFWEFHCKGFSQPCRDLGSEDVTNKTREKIKNIMSKILSKRRKRLLVKITGWSRMGFLNEIFNDAKFIHIVRDGRAVTNSILNVDWWWGWRGPGNWRWGPLTPTQQKEWESYNKSFIALAGIQWKIIIDAVEAGEKFINKNNFLEIKYEDLCSNTVEIFKDVIKFCELEWNKKFENQIKKSKIKNTNYKWQEELTEKQKQILNDILYDYLKEYEYIR